MDKKNIEKKWQERQYRNLVQFHKIGTEVESKKRIDSNYYVEGYATTFEPYVLYELNGEPVYEKFDRNCFIDCDMDDIIFQYNHEGRVYARKSNGTLIVEPTDNGLFIACDLGKSADGRNLYEEIANGLTTKMSWGFMPLEYEYDEKTRTLIHKRIKKIYDVSAVSIPANNNTEIQARSFVDGEIDKRLMECKKRVEKIKKLQLKIKMECEV